MNVSIKNNQENRLKQMSKEFNLLDKYYFPCVSHHRGFSITLYIN